MISKAPQVPARLRVCAGLEVPKNDGPMIVHGSSTNGAACIEKIQSLIKQHSRGPAKAKAKPGATKPGSGKGSAAFPKTCSCCGAALQSISIAVDHLRNGKHWDKVISNNKEHATLLAESRSKSAEP